MNTSIFTPAPPRGWPGWRVWLAISFILAALSVSAAIPLDPGLRKVVVGVGLGLCLGILWLWFVFFSWYPRVARRWAFWVPLLLAGLFVGLVRIERTSGALGLEFAWRWSPHADELLNAAIRSDKNRLVDLSKVSPRDFPQFLGPERNSIVRHVRLSTDWKTTPPRMIWRQPIGAGWSGFVVVNGAAVTMEQRGTKEMVSCYDAETGESIWSHSIDARHATTLGYVGPRSTPTIHDGKVYAMGATGVLRSLDGRDGSVIWQRDLFREHGFSVADAEGAVAWGRAAAPLIVGDSLFIPLGGKAKGRKIGLLALHVQDGTTQWEGPSYQAAYASPVLMTLRGQEQIVMVNEDFVSSHNPANGDVLWEYPWPGKSNANASCSQPVQVDDEHVLLSKGYAIGAELLHVSGSGTQWSVTPTWKNRQVMKTKFSNVALKDGYAFGLDDGILNCVDVMTGERMWKRGRYGYGQVLLVGTHLLVLGEQGELAIVAASPDSYQELGRIQALEGQTWNTLCLVGPRLLIRNSEWAAAYELPTEAP